MRKNLYIIWPFRTICRSIHYMTISYHMQIDTLWPFRTICRSTHYDHFVPYADRHIMTQALVSLKKYMPPPLPYFKVNICPLPIPHFASIFFAYLWSFRWPNYIVTLPIYFFFRLPHLNINTGPPSDELDKNFQRKSHFLFFSHWNGYNHFRFALDFSYAFGIL